MVADAEAWAGWDGVVSAETARATAGVTPTAGACTSCLAAGDAVPRVTDVVLEQSTSRDDTARFDDVVNAVGKEEVLTGAVVVTTDGCAVAVTGVVGKAA